MPTRDSGDAGNHLLAKGSLVAVEIAVVRVLQAVLGDQRSSQDATADETLTEVLDTSRQQSGALVAISAAVAGPEVLSQGSSTGPDLGVDDGLVSLLGPHGSLTSNDVLGLSLSQASGEVVVVDALPALVGGAPRSTSTSVVDSGGGVGRGVLVKGLLDGLGQLWGLVDVVARIVGDISSMTAVEVEEVSRRDNDIVTRLGKCLDVGNAVVPRLHDDILGDLVGSKVGRENRVFPHHQATARSVTEDGQSLVDVHLGKVSVALAWVALEPIHGVARVVVAVALELIESDVEQVISEDIGQLAVHILDERVGARVSDIKLTRVGLNSRVVSPAIVIPPGISAGDGLLVNLGPAQGRVTRHVNLRIDTDTTLTTISDQLLDVLLGVNLTRRVSILGHLGVLLDLNRPGLGVGDVPVEDVQLGVGQSIDLSLERRKREEVTRGIVHDTTVGVLGSILNVDRLLNDEIAAVADDDLAEGLETVESTPNSLGLEGTLTGSGDIKGVRLINSVLKIGLQILNDNVDSLESSLLAKGLNGLVLSALGELGEWRELGDGLLPGLGNPSLLLDEVSVADVGLVQDVVLGSNDLEVVVDLDWSGSGPVDGARSGQGVDLDSLGDGEGQKADGSSKRDLHGEGISD
jgi:hypothetical protein